MKFCGWNLYHPKLGFIVDDCFCSAQWHLNQGKVLMGNIQRSKVKVNGELYIA
jgi:hypothetical protein